MTYGIDLAFTLVIYLAQGKGTLTLPQAKYVVEQSMIDIAALEQGANKYSFVYGIGVKLTPAAIEYKVLSKFQSKKLAIKSPKNSIHQFAKAVKLLKKTTGKVKFLMAPPIWKNKKLNIYGITFICQDQKLLAVGALSKQVIEGDDLIGKSSLILTHELGHAFGAHHYDVDDVPNIMHPKALSQYPQSRVWDEATFTQVIACRDSTK